MESDPCPEASGKSSDVFWGRPRKRKSLSFLPVLFWMSRWWLSSKECLTLVSVLSTIILTLWRSWSQRLLVVQKAVCLTAFCWPCYCSCSVIQSCLTLCNPMDCSMPGSPVLHLPEFVGRCLLSQWCHPTISSSITPSPPASVFLSIKVFSKELALHIRWPKYCSFSFIISPSNEYSGLIPFRIDWFDLEFFPFWLKRWFDLRIDWLTLGQVYFAGVSAVCSVCSGSVWCSKSVPI